MSCDPKLSFEECEMTLMRQSIEDIEKLKGENLINNPNIQSIIKSVKYQIMIFFHQMLYKMLVS